MVSKNTPYRRTLLNRKEKDWKVWYKTTQPLPNSFQPYILDSENSKLDSDYSLLLSFTLIIRTSKLTKTSHYNSYQNKLYRLVKFLKEERGIGYRRISHILFDKGYRTIRSNKPIMNNYVYSIYQKGKIRENRIERSFDSKIEDVRCFVKYL